MTNPGGKKDLQGLHLGLQLAFCSLGGMAIGYWLDKRWLPSPLGMLGGLFAGSVLGMYLLAKTSK